MQAVDISKVVIPEEHKANTPENYRRRLIELAECLEYIDDSAWCYVDWVKDVDNQAAANTGHVCGSAACALGHATDIPEAFQAGIRFNTYHGSCPTIGAFALESAKQFYGLYSDEFSYIFYASKSYDKGLPILSLKNSTRLDVANAIRALVDYKYPAPKPNRVEKPGTKRWCAKKLREAAKWIEDHGWCQSNYFKYDGGQLCGCAHGGISSVSNGECQSYITGVVNLAAAGWATAVAVAARWSESANCPGYVKEKDAWKAHYYAHIYGATFSFNDIPGRKKEEVCQQLRAAAYAVEHGGKLPSWAPSLRGAS